MSCESSSATLLRAHGLRLTQQRAIIVAALRHADGHRGAQDLLREARERHPRVHASTIYRTLTALRERGLVSETDLGTGELSYTWIAGDTPHHHLVCHNCRGVIELPHRYLEPLEHRLESDFHFRPSLQHFAIFGLCRACGAAQATTSAQRGAPRPSGRPADAHPS